jgi:hypothetical protein
MIANPKERFATSFILVVVTFVVVCSFFAALAEIRKSPYADLHDCSAAEFLNLEKPPVWHCTDRYQTKAEAAAELRWVQRYFYEANK